MATEVNLPALGESVTEGTVTRWLKQVGDQVAVDEPLLEVSTDKVDTEIPSPVAGTLLEIKANEDDTVEVGAVLAIVGAEDEASSDSGSGGGSDQSDQQDQQDQQGGAGSPAGGAQPAGAAAGAGRAAVGTRAAAGRRPRPVTRPVTSRAASPVGTARR
ncbi:biotin/lipoyl-containing protein [Nocardioides sp. TF02-7]|uniref:biotin/lipoyl-containing protein n=1 Tax=Nocardioides sp. TF02-7 TaxID=2917724 RepID=UPI001F05219F|nr:biotin/lipoyl-containing protein [Nocardioides sp. TF02-7]UMG92709.1 hypothetical protein MF408_23840 [Nocardioides sp. TF02-7]